MTDSQTHWDNRYQKNPELNPFSDFLPATEKYLPSSGSCVDIAGGNGRNALWYAEKGYSTSLIDISPIALNQATEASHNLGVEIECIHWDLENNSLPPNRQWDIALITLFLDRNLLQKVPNFLNDSGILLLAHPTKQNLERHEHPSPNFLLEPAEIFKLGESFELAHSMEVIHVDEAWRDSGRHEAWLVCQK
ncbi:MAG TPA: class I SAM-dependent methyltransferase [Acidimicrobiales bacterium]|nr:class I SAM-dependent methyltransferase [Acidimicrobiales bacterium]